MKKIITLIYLIIFLCSCSSKVPFTYEIKHKYGLTNEDLQKLQFYLSGEMLFRHQITTTKEEKISGSKIKIYQDRLIKEVVFKEDTPGVADSVLKNDFLIVKFEDGKRAYLIFGNPGKQGSYYLIGDKNLTGEMYYNGMLYKMVNYKLAFAKENTIKKYSETELREVMREKRSGQHKIELDDIVTYYPYLLVEEVGLERLFDSKKNRRFVTGEKVKD